MSIMNNIPNLYLKIEPSETGPDRFNKTMASSVRSHARPLDAFSSGDPAMPEKLDTSSFVKEIKYEDNLREEDFAKLRKLVLKRKE